MTSVLSGLKEGALASFRDMSRGFSSVLWLDFPDYSNVGDSAIWLGQHAMAVDLGLEERGAWPVRGYSDRRLRGVLRDPSVLPVINGGGNFGGRWSDSQRLRVAALRVTAGRVLAQAPQSIEVSRAEEAADILAAMREPAEFRLLVRDRRSMRWASEHGITARMSPDPSHYLHPLQAAEPTRPYVVLRRTDNESASLQGYSGVDWLQERHVTRRVRQLRSSLAALTGSDLPAAGIDYTAVARERLARGVAMLEAGEVVVTDRLHGMLVALLLGRRVHAVDNGIGKLSAYAEAWFPPDWSQVRFFPDFETATAVACA